MLGAFSGLISFVATQAWNENKDQKGYVKEIQKDLYDKGAKSLTSLDEKYGYLFSLMTSDHALSTYQYGKEYRDFFEAFTKYQGYLIELQRYGNSEQVEIATALFDWYRLLYADFHSLRTRTELLEQRVKEHLEYFAPFKTKEQVANFHDSFSDELDQMMQHENGVYYEVLDYKMPNIRARQQLLFFQFRQSLGLDATADMTKSINAIAELSKRAPEKKYTEKELPFMFAEQRVFLAATLEFPMDDFSVKRNEHLKEMALYKIASRLIDANPHLKDKLGTGE